MRTLRRHPALKRRAILAYLLCIWLPPLSSSKAAPAAVPAPRPVTPAQMHTLIAAQRGHVVLVNFWATWCDTCREEFPALVQTAHRYKAMGLVTFAVSADMPADIRTKALPFLQKQGADWPQYAQQGANITNWAAAFDPQWTPAAYPRTYVYDRRGRLVKTLDTPQTAAGFAAAVRPFLAH